MHGFVEGAGSVGDHEDLKAFVKGTQGRERHAHVGHHTGNDDLLAAGGLDGLDEIFVVPRVDLARARNVRRVGEQFFELRHQWAVGAAFKAGGQDGRQVEELRHVGQGQHVVLELVGGEILHQGDQAGLVINQQNNSIVFVQALVSHG